MKLDTGKAHTPRLGLGWVKCKYFAEKHARFVQLQLHWHCFKSSHIIQYNINGGRHESPFADDFKFRNEMP
jgi:hypothetical protein